MIFITLGSDPPPLESDKNIFYFLDTRIFFAPRKAEKTKNEVKAVKLAVLAESGNVLAAPPGMPAALRGMPAALSGVLALRDTHGKSMGA